MSMSEGACGSTSFSPNVSRHDVFKRKKSVPPKSVVSATVSAYDDADRICISGQPISGVEASTVGDCALIVAGFTAWGESFIDALRHRLEAQYGWQFDHSWPADGERSAIAEALAGEAADAG